MTPDPQQTRPRKQEVVAPAAISRPLPTDGVIRIVVLPFLFLSLFFYALVRIQEGVLGRVLIAHEHIRIVGLLGLVIAIAFALVAATRVRITEPRVTGFLAVYAFYLTVDFVVRALWAASSLPALVYGETYFYFFVFFTLLLFLLGAQGGEGRRIVVEGRSFRAFYVMAILAFVIGYAQYLLNEPLLSVSSDESGYGVEVYLNSKVHHVRAFSIFGSAFTYGHVITLVAALALSALVLKRADRKQSLWFGALFGMATLAAASTLTRNTYLEFALSLAAVPCIKWLIDRRWRDRSIIATSMVSSGVVYAGLVVFFVVARSFAGGILDLTTFGIRLVAVAAVVVKYFFSGNSAIAILFGHGLMQGDKFAELQGIRPLLFDNTYVDVALFSGLVGLGLYVAFVCGMFAYVLRQYRRSHAYWWLALAGLYFAYPVVAAVNIHVSTLFLLTCIVQAYDIMATRRVAPIVNRTSLGRSGV